MVFFRHVHREETDHALSSRGGLPSMDQHYERLRYFLFVSRQTHTGVGCYEAWHMHGSFRKPREDRYKNIDRATIRKPRIPAEGKPSASSVDA
jgi:hypothetical protein